MKGLKKALSLLCSVAMIASTLVAFSAVASASTETPTIKVTLDYTTLNVGDTITVKYSYEGFNRINYDDGEGSGGIMTSLQFKGIIPGLTTSANEGYFQKAGAVTELFDSSVAVTGSPKYDVGASGDANFVTSVVFSNENKAPVTTSGDLYSVKIKIKKAIDKDLTFGFVPASEYDTYYYISQMIDWVKDPTSATKYTDIAFETATIPAQTGGNDEEEITVKNAPVTEYTGEKTLIYVAKVLQKADASKKVVLTKNGEKQYSDRTLAQILGGVAATGSTLSGDVAIGVLTNDTTATFGFELVD